MKTGNRGSWSGTAPITYEDKWQVSTDGVSWADVVQGASFSDDLMVTHAGKLLRFCTTASNAATAGGPGVSVYSTPVTLPTIGQPVTLPALTLTLGAGPFQLGTSAVAAGATLATVSGAAQGATLSVPQGETRYVLNTARTAVLVGASGLTVAEVLAISIVQTLAGATNTPRTTTASITVTAAANGGAIPTNPLNSLQGARLVAGGSPLLSAFTGSPVTASGGVVSVVADQTAIAQPLGLGVNPNAPKMFQSGDAGFQPGYFNGRPYLSFDGTNQHLASDAIASASGAALIVATIRRRATQPADYGCPVTIMGTSANYNGAYPILRPYFRPGGGLYAGTNDTELGDLAMPADTAAVVALRRTTDGMGRLRVNDTIGTELPSFPNPFPGRVLLGNSPMPGSEFDSFTFTGAFEISDLWVGDNLGDENLIVAYFGYLLGLKQRTAVDAAWTARQAATITGTAETAPTSSDGTVTPVPAINTEYPVTAFAPIPLTLEGTGAPAGSIHTQMVEFQRGHVMPGDPITYKTAGGVKCATQYDTATQVLWGDGSIRITSLHVEGPTLANTVKDAGSIVKEATVSGTALNLATALSGRSCVIEIKNGANVFTFDVIANLPQARWFQGNLKSSAQVIVNIPRAAVGGNTPAKLQVDIAIDKAGVVTCEPRVTNFSNWTTGLGDAFYDYKLTGDGVVQAVQTAVKTALGSSYGVERQWAVGGSARARPFYHKKNTEYLSRTGITFNYDQQLGVDESVLAYFATRRAASDWNTPNNNRDVKKDMGAQGGNPSIGFTTQPQAAWLISGDRRALEYINDQSEAAQTIPWHHKDPDYGDRWANPVDQPYGRATWHDGGFTEPSTVKNDSRPNEWALDEAHWGDMHTVVYLATARRSCIDGINGQASFAVMGRNPGYERQIPTGDSSDTVSGRNARLASIANDGQGFNLRMHVQTRAYGWSDRQVNSAVAVVPASETPFGDLWMRAQIGKFKKLLSEIPLATVNQKDAHGFPMDMDLADEYGAASPWQAVFAGSQLVRAARLEIPGAIEYLDWSDNWYSGGFSRPDFVAADMTQYRLILLQGGNTHADVNSTAWSSWAQMKSGLDNRTTGFGPSFGDNFSASTAAAMVAGIGDYQRRYWALTTQIHDVLADFGKDTTKVAAASAFFANMPKAKTFSTANDFKLEGVNSIVRRGATRVGVA